MAQMFTSTLKEADIRISKDGGGRCFDNIFVERLWRSVKYEDIYLKEDFLPLFERRAIAVAHPDLASSGGILETKKIGDLAQEHGIAMALHMAMSPIAALASVHCAAATENFMVLENHSVDQLEQWSSLVEGLPVPLIEDGHIAVPEGPGLGGEVEEAKLQRMIAREPYQMPKVLGITRFAGGGTLYSVGSPNLEALVGYQEGSVRGHKFDLREDDGSEEFAQLYERAQHEGSFFE